jgi:hypothetical protein
MSCNGLYLKLFVSYVRYLYCLCIVVSNTYWLCVTWRVSYKREELIILLGRMGSAPFFCEVRVAPLFYVFCVVCFVLFIFALCIVYPNVASYSGLSILNCHFRFLQRLFGSVCWLHVFITLFIHFIYIVNSIHNKGGVSI